MEDGWLALSLTPQRYRHPWLVVWEDLPRRLRGSWDHPRDNVSDRMEPHSQRSPPSQLERVDS
jgi:hypothetical protein